MIDLDVVASTAATASAAWAAMPPRERARALVAAADALTPAQEELVRIAREETGLTEARLNGELMRTAVQLRMFADVVVDGGYLDVRIDEADTEFVLGVRPDLRRYRQPVGPVLNFAASNFPFAFSVAGGDTASALAAGCAVIVKGHPGHPRLSLGTVEIVTAALEGSGAPSGILQLVAGQQTGIDLLNDPRIAAGSFTGSTRIGRMLANIAAARPVPIPFYGELGSVNPVFVTRAALDERAEEIADEFVTSVSGSAGQLCTKPGFLFAPAAEGFAELIASRVAASEHRLLNPSIAGGYRERRDTILATPGVETIVEGSLRLDNEAQGWATPTIVRVSAGDLIAQRDRLLDEAFGPLSVIVEYEGEESLVALVDELFDGNLTGTVHAGRDEDSSALRSLIAWIAGHAGRVLFGGWPTGVAVTSAQQHGGPWPATTNDTGTSVGGTAISRFLRPVAYQSVPQRLLPEPLRDDNPWHVPQQRAAAGESRSWGESYRSV
ncbi:aldehyde dehydrogenase (NADP(+)) [Cryobacterium tagatosivorans]|uniref:Aldehyde dehydrogenase (NADP(+)) n=1 Tax=Cryobacterium tagatosivorans TaxID=1259199 RepID=A0A4R8UJ72_9MICO|nr:aldehyde dehydrogenase (NADP(+)) [Cryobacterium tagatosivorans]TFB56745.1 aldehyde dehydrogenase (NADP(+)) [Cryobacterium tagatosivorans]